MNPIIAAEKIIELVWGTKDFPVDPVTIAKKLGLRVLETDLPENVSGALIKAAGKDPAIVVHYADSDNRKRFTCAHELGHYVSRMASQNKENSYEYIDLRSHEASSGENEDEKFANNFAANLLMPENIVSKMSSRGSNRIEMALHFGVSNEALKYRLMNLKLFHEESFVWFLKNRDEKDLVTAVIESLADSPKTSELDPLTNQQVEDRVADRALKKLYAKWFIGILIAQLLLMNYIFIKVGYGKLNFNQWTLELYVTSTILEVFGVVVVITNNLFPKKSNIGRA